LITLLSFESGDQFMILCIVPGVTVGLSILDMTDWDIYRNMTLPVLYVMMPTLIEHYKGYLTCMECGIFHTRIPTMVHDQAFLI
jgi:hypothetical protein